MHSPLVHSPSRAALRRLAGRAAAALAPILCAGCCNEVTSTQCIEWDQSTTCPPPELVEEKLGEVKGRGTFWPAHEYLIDGVRRVEPAACCYVVTTTVCTEELH